MNLGAAVGVAVALGVAAGAAAQVFRGECAFSEIVAVLLLGFLLGLPVPGLPAWFKKLGTREGEGGA